YTPEDRRILIFGPQSSASFWVCDPEAGKLSPVRGKHLRWAYDVTPSPDGRVWARSSQQKITEFFAADGGPEPAPPLVHPDWTFSARCKSTEEGLDQDFNSLDAQREAAEAYVHSQAHAGWTWLPQHYDDGGYTGSNLDRPALQRLLADIQAGQIDCVVTQRVD